MQRFRIQQKCSKNDANEQESTKLGVVMQSEHLFYIMLKRSVYTIGS